jgi:DNA-binding HxlR family transcriptional regulator
MNDHLQTADADLPPSAAMLRMISGSWVSRIIYIAAKLGLADLLKDGPRSCEDLAQSTGTHAASLYRVLRALASAGVFAEDDQRRFTLTPLAATLQTDAPGSLRAWAILVLGEERYRAWGDLMHSVRTGEVAFDHVFGMGVWEYGARHPEHGKILDEAMANLLAAYNASVLAGYSFSTIRKTVDVGGGDGSLIIGLLQANPGMTGVLFDLPHVAEKAKKRIADVGLTSRCEVVAGDALASVPSGGEAYVLSRIMDSWDDEHATAILKNCRRAMTPKAKLLLVERVLPVRVEYSAAVQPLVMSDLNMMVITGGRERTAIEFGALVEATGFRLTKIIPSQSVMSVIECAPA